VSTDIIAPALANIERVIIDNNPFKAFENAVKFANETILREMQKTVGHVGSIVDSMSQYISKTLIELTRAQVALEQAAQKAAETVSNTTNQNSGGSVGSNSPTYGNNGGSTTPGGTYTTKLDMVKREVYAMARTILSQFGPIHAPTLDQVNSYAVAGLAGVLQGKQTYTQLMAGFYGPQTGVAEYVKQTIVNSYSRLKSSGVFYNGGLVPSFANGGSVVPGYSSQSVPAMLHGGEYVMSSKAVSNIGIAALEALNGLRNTTFNDNSLQGISRKKYDVPMQKAIEVLNNLDVGRNGATTQGAHTNHTENVNIYVENFVGQEEWFKTMVKQYNMTVLPMKQKSAGMENRVVTSYTGLARGM
jgi:hypothetical protein